MFRKSEPMTLIKFLAVNLCVYFFAASAVAQSLASVSGTVYDAAGNQPVANAQVFIEESLIRSVRVMRTDASGRYVFPDVIPGTVNVFAYAEGYAFNGFSILAGAGDTYDSRSILLGDPSSISGKVTNTKKKGIAEAQITRVLLVNGNVRDADAKKFSIPFTKIRRLGFQVPTSDSKGAFVINRLPVGETAYIKAAHLEYAQQVVSDVNVGTLTAKVVLSPGVLISGSIVSLGNGSPVPNAPIVFRNSLPPNDTTITRAGADGVFALRLRPSAYTYESVGATYTSTSKPKLLVTGEYRTQEVDLIVAGKGSITGTVKDPVTGEAVIGAQVVLKTNGKAYKIAKTNTKGEYTFAAPEGECSVNFWRAAGYTHSTPLGYSFNLLSNTTKTLDSFWLTAIPSYSLEVVDGDKGPVSGAVVQILHPRQMGWRATDENGQVKISMATLPEKGIVVGYVDHPVNRSGALFVIDSTRKDDAIVQLLPIRTLEGNVTNADDKGRPGQLVTCDLGHANLAQPINLWKTMTDATGHFRHPGVVEGVSLMYSAMASDAPDTEMSSPALFTISGPESATLPTLSVLGRGSGSSLIGKKFPWRRLKKIVPKGSSVNENLFDEKVVVFARSIRAALLLESLEYGQQLLNPIQRQFVLVVDEPTELTSDVIPIYKGTPPASADVYRVSGSDEVLFESVDVPSYAVIRDTPFQP